jgi:superfamily I DNA/RNA helicase
VDPADWEVAVGHTDGPQIVVGGPGTGKTEFLVRRAVHLLGETGLPPGQLLVLSFGRRGVADVRDRIRTALDSSTSTIDVATFHSFAARLLETFSAVRGWAEAPQVLTGPEQMAVIQELLATENPKRWSPAFRDLLGSATFAREVTDFVLRTRELLLEGDALAERSAGRADWKGISSFVARYDLELRRRSRVDYGTLLAEAVWAMDDPSVAAHIAERFRYVLVDEYQDTTVAQSRLLARLTPVDRNLTVAADPYQSIYSFRGATLDNVANFPNDFPAEDGTPAQRLILTTSFRTPAAVLEAAVRVTSHELPGAAGRVIPAADGGRVDVHSFDQETEEAEWIAAEIQRLHLEEGIPYRRIGVFVRSKRRFLPDLSRALHRRRIPHDTPDSRLADHPAVRFVMDAVIAATNDDGRDETARSTRTVARGRPVSRYPHDNLAGGDPFPRARWGSARRTPRRRLVGHRSPGS